MMYRMDKLEGARLRLIGALQEHIDKVEVLARETTAIAREAEQGGNMAFADALWWFARQHRVEVIRCRAQCEALRGGGDRDDQGLP